MNERPARPTADIVSRQRLAGDPRASAWVEANAGSGKTHVLTQRVLRLLLSGVAPENLLCLTYTKAAAAEMRRRVADRLGHWAVSEDDRLRKELEDLEGASPGQDVMARARTLFGHALETPGGLRINTIHAFCESVLHRFPLEAGVPFAFSVIEEAEQADLIRTARDRILADGLEGWGPCAEAVGTLFALMSDTQIDDGIREALAKSEDLRKVLADPAAAKRNLRDLVGDRDGETVKSLREEIVAGALLPPNRYADVLAVCPPEAGKDRFEERLAAIDRLRPDPDAILAAFLTKDGAVPKRFPKKDLAEAPGGLGDTLLAEAERLAAVVVRIKRAGLVARSEALVDVLAALHADYERRKRARSLLDFDDLIARMAHLLGSGESSAWVRYKLDAGITHILVDESQDTNPAQWQVVRALSDDFFDGEGTGRQRTIFAVGDKKQSIYSFQGAVPQLFSETGEFLGRKAARLRDAGQSREAIWNRVRLRASFRTLREILEAVDRVCGVPHIADALLIDGQEDGHESAREHKGGSVTLWPPVQQQDVEMPDDRWPMDRDIVEQRNAARIVAERIAATIRRWIAEGRPLAQRGRAVTADDVLILVQSRGPLFQEIVRALKSAGLPSPGSDKLPVSTHIAVQDLLALADILLNPADDLNLAAVLRSPLFDIDEDGLFAIAANRKSSTTLWSALRASADPAAMEAYERLSRWRGRLDFDRPYDLFSRILYAEGGLRRFHARLGEEVDDVLAEFLDLAFGHERSAQPSLQGFLAAMRRSHISIRRDLAETGGGVRVMTVHGAKGLEAPIVFLADAATGPNTQKLGKPVYVVSGDHGPLLVHAASKKDHLEHTAIFRDRDEDNQRAEYWRKLYVGMTRAEDELYVTGMLTRRGKLEGTWYEAIETALDADLVDVDGPDGETARRFPRELPPPLPVTADGEPAPATRTAYMPKPLARPEPVEFVQPSSAGPDRDAVFETAAESLIDAELARKQGIALHALLQHLSRIRPEQRRDVAMAALGALLPEEPERHVRLAAKAIGVLEAPANAQLFGPDTRAEVPFLATGTRNGRSVRIAGRIDRLLVAEDHVLAVDFKSDANPPSTIDKVPQAYLTQLGLYVLVGKKLFAPRPIRGAIFWTADESLMPLPENVLSAATEGFTLA